MTQRKVFIHTPSISEVEFILLSPGIGCCHWPLSSCVARHRQADDDPAGQSRWQTGEAGTQDDSSVEHPNPQGSDAPSAPD